MLKFYHLILIIIGFSFAYDVGETISIYNQNKELEICYAAELDTDNDGTFSLADYNGDLNGGQYNVFLIDMSATWCAPCFSLIPHFDDVASEWQDNEYFKTSKKCSTPRRTN